MKNDPLHCEEANEEIHCPYASYLSAINMLSSLIEYIIFCQFAHMIWFCVNSKMLEWVVQLNFLF